eukprot:9411749-Alexandrium_andersonii.AAC.1
MAHRYPSCRVNLPRVPVRERIVPERGDERRSRIVYADIDGLSVFIVFRNDHPSARWPRHAGPERYTDSMSGLVPAWRR